MTDATPAREPLHARLGWLLVLLVAAAVFLPWLGSTSLDSSEGLRIAPAWAMLESGDLFHQSIFERTYIRKPPGIAWAIGAATAVFGPTEWGVRLPSALAGIVMSLSAWAFTRRWMGDAPGTRSAALGAGLAQALLPLLWSPGRTAEIEMLLCLCTQVGAFALAERLFIRCDCWRHAAMLTLLGALGIAGAIIMKGPAALPVFAGVLLAACVLHRSLRPLLKPALWVSLALAAAIVVPLAMAFHKASADPDAVTEPLSAFLWSRNHLGGVLTLLPAAFIAALPASLALLFPFGKSARSERVLAGDIGDILAYGLAWAWVLSLLVFTASGVANARYAMPASVLLAPVVANLIRRTSEPDPMIPARRRIASALLLGRGRLWACGLLLAALVVAGITAERQKRHPEFTGRRAGEALAAAVSRGTLWADDLIEARADVLLTARQIAPALRPRWGKAFMLKGELPPAGDLLLLRTDDPSAELARYTRAIDDNRLTPIHSGRVERYTFTVYRVNAD